MAIARLKDSGLAAHSVYALDATTLLSTDLVVTPVRTKENRLKLISWRYNNDGTLLRVADSGNTGAFVGSVACPPLCAPGRIFTALRQGEQLTLMEWKCDTATGTPSVITSGVSGSSVTGLGASLGPADSYISLVRNTEGRLQLASWKQGVLGKLGEAMAGPVSAVTRPVASGSMLTTAVILGCAERLRLIVWSLAASGEITRLGDSDNQAGTVSRISCAHIAGKWATAVRDGNGLLKVIFWDITAAGAPKRIGDSGPRGDEIIDVDIAGLDFNDVAFGGADIEWRVVTAVRTKNSKLRVLTWAWKQATEKVVVVDDSGEQPETISLLRLLNVTNSRFLTAVRDDATATTTQPGHLKLITWKIP
jgi:hypothetical protein